MALTDMRVSTALHTDRYELTMLDALLAEGRADQESVFQVFARKLPVGRRYGVVAGTGRLLEALEGFRFGEEELGYLADQRVVSDRTLRWLADYRFSGAISGFREGEVYFPNSPVLTVTGPLGEAMLLETLVLSVLNHDSAIASAASRTYLAAAGRTLIEMGGRRADDNAAVAAARAAYLAGFTATSNLEAGRLYGVPTVGTSAHAFTLAHPDERCAFDAQIAALGAATTLLVDTYDTGTGIRTAVEAAQSAGAAGPDAIRIDSGDLAVEARRARAQLDRLGATGTRIVVSGDLDEHSIAALADAPVDTYGVGTSVVTGSGAPTAGFVYKLVAVADASNPSAPLRPVAKTSAGKATVGGRKVSHRVTGHGAVVEVLLDPDSPTTGWGPPLEVPLVEDGKALVRPDLDGARAHHRTVVGQLPAAVLDLTPGPVFTEARPLAMAAAA